MALLGRRDEPTDAVEEYCRYLGTALAQHGFSFEVERVPWAERGWRAALRELRLRAAAWRGAWVCVQYTALAWSRRGFPIRIPALLRALKRSGVRCAVVFHDAEAYHGRRIVDRIRRTLQLYTMREALRLVDLAVITIPQEKVRWLPPNRTKTVFIPVGANLPSPEKAWAMNADAEKELPSVAVFTVTGDLTGDRAGQAEVECIARAVRYTAERIGTLQVALLGRNSETAAKRLSENVRDTRVRINVYGLLDAESVVRVLGLSDVLLFVRGALSTRRGSAIAGIACGLPVIALEGWETTPPINDAGVVLLPEGLSSEFGPALVRVLTDSAYRASLAERSRRAYREHFSWTAIAQKYAAALSTR